MRTTLLAFHGFTLNGGAMLTQMGGLPEALAPHVDLLCVDAPHTCTPESVDRLYASWPTPRCPPPHLCWWDATDDGSVYHGWEQTLELVTDLLGRHAPVGLLGFSQGAILAGVIAALSSSGALAPIQFAVLIAGRMARATNLTPSFEAPIRVPSLHIWGERDRWVAAEAPLLLERFDPASRASSIWEGSHQIPTVGSAASLLVDFVRTHR